MDDCKLQAWKEWRAKGYPPSSFRYPPAEPPLKFEHGSRAWIGNRDPYRSAEWCDKEFRYVAHLIHDENDNDGLLCDALGKFTNEGEFPETFARPNPKSREFKRFKPAYSIREATRDYHLQGMSTALAYQTAVEDAKTTMRRAEQYGETWFDAYLEVHAFPLTASDEDVEDENNALGTSTIYGIASDEDNAYLGWMAYNHAKEAAELARKALVSRVLIMPDGTPTCEFCQLDGVLQHACYLMYKSTGWKRACSKHYFDEVAVHKGFLLTRP